MKYADIKNLYKAVIENMNEIVWVGDKNFKTLYVNPKGYKLTGYKKSDVIGKNAYKFWDKESAEKIEKQKKRSGKETKAGKYLGNIVSAKKEKIPVLLNATELEDGEIIAIITDLRELEDKENMYRQLVENMNEGVWMGDEQERTIYANPKFCEMVGYGLEEIIGKKSYVFWDKKSAEKVKKVNEGKRKQGISSSYEGNLVNKEGKVIPVLLSGTPLENGGTIGIMTDLRVIKEKEEKENILKRAIQHANDAIIIFDTKGKITSWNKGARIIFGYRAEEVIGSDICIILNEDEADLISKKTKRIERLDFYAKNKSNKEVRVAATLTPIFQGESNKISAYLIIARDITVESKFEEERIIKYQKTREAYQKFGVIRRQMDYILELLDLSSETKNPQNVADFIVSSIIMLTHVDACVLRIFNKKNKTLDLLSSFGVGDDWRGKSSIQYKNSLLEKAYKAKMPLKIVDISRETLYQSIPLARKNNLYSLLLIALSFKGELIGSLSLYANPDRRLEIFENEFIEKYASAIEVALSTIIKCEDQK